MTRSFSVGLALVLMAGAATAKDAVPARALRINDVAVIGTHNSY